MKEWQLKPIEPLDGSTRLSTKPWEDVALSDRDDFTARLVSAGFPHSQIQAFLKERDDAEFFHQNIAREIADFNASNHRRYINTPPELLELYHRSVTVLDRLREFFGSRRIRVDESVAIKARIPLFIFGAPDTEGSTAEATLQHSTSGAMDWSVKLLGVGISGSSNIEVSVSATFPSAKGEVKMVIQEVDLLAEKITILENGHPIATNKWRVDVSKARPTGQPGLVLISEPPPLGDVLDKYPLAGDSTGAIAKYEYSFQLSGELNLDLGVTIQGTDIGLKAKIASSRTIKAAFGLRTGVNYELHKVRNEENSSWPDGLVWPRSVHPNSVH